MELGLNDEFNENIPFTGRGATDVKAVNDARDFIDEVKKANADYRAEAAKKEAEREAATHYIDNTRRADLDDPGMIRLSLVCSKETIRLAGTLISKQGDNPYGAKDTSGLVSVANLLTIAGKPIDEAKVAKKAFDKDLCLTADGKTTPEQQARLLSEFGLKAEVMPINKHNLNKLEDFVRKGHGVIINMDTETLASLYEKEKIDEIKRKFGLSNPTPPHYTGFRDTKAGEMTSFIVEPNSLGTTSSNYTGWANNPALSSKSLSLSDDINYVNYLYSGEAPSAQNYAACIMGEVKKNYLDMHYGQLVTGYYVCDSASENNMKFISVKDIPRLNGCAVVTKNPIRQPSAI